MPPSVGDATGVGGSPMTPPGGGSGGGLPRTLDLMNPMFFIEQRNPGRAKHWWIRVGTKDTDTSLTVVGNLAAGLDNLVDDVDALMYWDAGHGANEDAADS
ncbi:hypothetical protein [Streptomyces sp. BRA346]|uniref:hypothetical protein n=1 Tax=Streptomyces sp. BRA346 TaxID=2878199 RepID=UPI004062ADA7